MRAKKTKKKPTAVPTLIIMATATRSAMELVVGVTEKDIESVFLIYIRLLNSVTRTAPYYVLLLVSK